MHSFTEENYLKTIYSLALRQDGVVSTNALAEVTATKAASVTDMLRKLADKELIHYKKYQGVRLTDEGERLALQVIRRHRLWEVFLVETLGFGWDAVHDIAEELEHIRSDELTTRLDAFLNHPKFDPHGDPIPTPAGQMPKTGYRTLPVVGAGAVVRLMGVLEHSTDFLQHLDRCRLTLGSAVTLDDINAFDRSMMITTEAGDRVFVSFEVARNLLVE